jgi:cytidine deaminase
MDPTTRETVVRAAIEARANAYAPYSVYNVGAAALAADGSVHPGCNVENASSGLTVCAERNAIARMVASGSQRLLAVAIATQDGGPPCGACLQVIQEFAEGPEADVLLVDESGTVVATTLGALLPQPFTGKTLKRC